MPGQYLQHNGTQHTLNTDAAPSPAPPQTPTQQYTMGCRGWVPKTPGLTQPPQELDAVNQANLLLAGGTEEHKLGTDDLKRHVGTAGDSHEEHPWATKECLLPTQLPADKPGALGPPPSRPGRSSVLELGPAWLLRSTGQQTSTHQTLQCHV